MSEGSGKKRKNADWTEKFLNPSFNWVHPLMNYRKSYDEIRKQLFDDY